MAFYKVEVKKSALKDIEKLDRKIVAQIFRKIESLANNPRPIQSLKLSGSERSHRLRIGSYRILYQIDDDLKLITIFAVGHRKDIYKNT